MMIKNQSAEKQQIIDSNEFTTAKLENQGSLLKPVDEESKIKKTDENLPDKSLTPILTENSQGAGTTQRNILIDNRHTGDHGTKLG